jgi:hypothetical protein
VDSGISATATTASGPGQPAVTAAESSHPSATRFYNGPIARIGKLASKLFGKDRLGTAPVIAIAAGSTSGQDCTYLHLVEMMEAAWMSR